MKRISATVFAAFTLIGGLASAQQLGDHGTFAIGVDRMFGFTSYNRTYDVTPPGGTRTSYDRTTTNFSFLGRTGAINVAQVPRLSFDAFLGPGVSIGGSLMYDYYSQKNKANGTEDPDKPSTGIWLVSPRVGFAHMITPQVGIWPRLGITYLHASNDDPSTNPTTGVVTNYTSSTGLLYYTMDVNLVVTPVPHVGFTVGPTLDYLLSRSYSSTPADTTPESNYKDYAIGVQAGFLGWF